ncbi:hypothetical protein OPV22_013658 [Ensete ventricosum]|uniref:Uncharacterized protein n=1 Tax=Ensete ventricosum TaxID=4639 RepID=A0AAV8R9R5_ENSVE|nr:hypothetical protein OPV22_013658 [Ensete ventricosum]
MHNRASASSEPCPRISQAIKHSNWGSPFRPSRSLRLPSSSQELRRRREEAIARPHGERRRQPRTFATADDKLSVLKPSIAPAAAAGNIRNAVERLQILLLLAEQSSKGDARSAT